MRPRSLIASIHPRLAVVLHDLGMVWLAWVAANWLRYSIEPNPPPLVWFMPETGLAVLAQGLVLWWTGLYKGLGRFARGPGLRHRFSAHATPQDRTATVHQYPTGIRSGPPGRRARIPRP